MTKQNPITKIIDFAKADRDIFGSAKKNEVLENGFFNIGSQEFKNAFAYHQDGFALVNLKTARSYSVIKEQQELIKAGLIPRDVKERKASAAKLASVFDVRISNGDQFNEKTMNDQLYDIFELAARLRGSDVKFIISSEFI